jgi:hypothetical protein
MTGIYPLDFTKTRYYVLFGYMKKGELTLYLPNAYVLRSAGLRAGRLSQIQQICW